MPAAASLASVAYETLRQALDNFQYVPGDRFSESEVGQQLGMSRTPVPEALVRLQREGYIRGFSEDATGAHPQLRIELKYFEGEPAIKHVARVSKPGRRVYSGSKELPTVRNGLGITIVSTPKGVLSDNEARTQNVGGEVLAEVF